jgi:hypothetical protein
MKIVFKKKNMNFNLRASSGVIRFSISLYGFSMSASSMRNCNINSMTLSLKAKAVKCTTIHNSRTLAFRLIVSLTFLLAGLVIGNESSFPNFFVFAEGCKSNYQT